MCADFQPLIQQFWTNKNSQNVSVASKSHVRLLDLPHDLLSHQSVVTDSERNVSSANPTPTTLEEKGTTRNNVSLQRNLLHLRSNGATCAGSETEWFPQTNGTSLNDPNKDIVKGSENDSSNNLESKKLASLGVLQNSENIVLKRAVRKEEGEEIEEVEEKVDEEIEESEEVDAVEVEEEEEDFDLGYKKELSTLSLDDISASPPRPPLDTVSVIGNATVVAKVQCDMCHKMFSSRNSLREHRITIHLQNGRFSCSQCGKRSVRWF